MKGEEQVGEDNIWDEGDFFEDEDVVMKKSLDEDKELVGRCRQCGHEIDIDDKVCPVCGEILERLSESAYA